MTASLVFFNGLAPFEEGRKGSLEAGKLAELVVTSANLTMVPVTWLRDVPIVFTVIGGAIVHDRS